MVVQSPGRYGLRPEQCVLALTRARFTGGCMACRQVVSSPPGGLATWHRALRGRGPRPDTTVAAEHAARHALVRLGILQSPYCVGAHAHDMVAVAHRVAGGLNPGHPRMPGPVSFVLLPAQQVADPAPGHLHD